MADENGLPGGYFGAFKYNGGGAGSYVDGTQQLAQKAEMVVSFQHEPTGKAVFFKAFITAFNESYTSDWVSETVFGRSDPIQHFKQTSRRIALAIVIPAATHSEAYENLGRVQTLTQFLYPNYSAINNSLTLTQNPLVRLKVMNLAQHVPKSTPKSNPSNTSLYNEYKSTADANQGLLGTITSMNVVHNLDNPEMGVIAKSANTILPKAIEVTVDFTVIHEEMLGWLENDFNSPSFPYGVQLSNTEAALPDGDTISPAKDSEETTEQERQRAQRRYGTAWGNARYDKDKAWLRSFEERNAYYGQGADARAIQRAAQSGDMTGLNADQKYLAKNWANYEYLSDTTEGVEDLAGGASKVDDYLD